MGRVDAENTHTRVCTTKPTSAQKAQRELTAQASEALTSARDTSEARPGTLQFTSCMLPPLQSPAPAQFVPVC